MSHRDGLEVKTLFRVEGPEAAQANTMVCYTLFAEDDHGKPKHVDVNKLDGWLRGPAEIRGRVVDEGGARYSIEFIPAVGGVYHLDVTTGGKPIFRKGDITTTITDHAPRVQERINFELEGQGLHSGRVGETGKITIHVMDSHRTPTNIDIDALEVKVIGPDTIRANVASHGSGSYLAQYNVRQGGDYRVLVTYDGRLVMEQDNVRFSDKSNASKSVVVSPPNTCRAGTNVHFKIQSKDSYGQLVWTGGDEWEAVATGPERVNHLQITDNLDGSYTGDFICPKPGVYSFEVRLHGHPASNSPFKVTAQ